MAILRTIASSKITLVGMLLLGIGATLSYGNPQETPIWVLIVPMAILAINLTAAIASNPRINQQAGLLLFHVCLLLTVILAAIGRLTHLDAHFEIPVGQNFHTDLLLEENAGPWHLGDKGVIAFEQGVFTVQYAPGIRRGLTHSHVRVRQKDGSWENLVVGDDRPLVIEGYRFYTTNNKGFTLVLTWIPTDGSAPTTGTVNMPSYPLFEYKQDNRWTPPGGEPIKFWLRVEAGLKEDQAWVLDGRNASGVMVVNTADKQRHEVSMGQSLELPGGSLKYEALTMWMGYRIFYDPTIQWLFYVTVFGVLGLSHYFWKKLNLEPWVDSSEANVAGKVARIEQHDLRNDEVNAAVDHSVSEHSSSEGEKREHSR